MEDLAEMPEYLRTQYLIQLIHNKFIYASKIPHEYLNEQICLEMVKQNGDTLRYVPDHLKTEHSLIMMREIRGYQSIYI